MVEDQRRRIAAALCLAAPRNGYHALTVLDICEAATVSRRTFYDLYRDKANAFCAIHGEALALLVSRTRRAAEPQRGWPQKVAAAIAAALEWAALEQGRAHLLTAEPFTAGPRPAYCHDLLVARFAPSLRCGRRYAAVELPPDLEGLLLGAFAGVVADRLRKSRAAELPGLAPQFTQLVLTAYESRP